MNQLTLIPAAPSIDSARAARNEGMTRATNHADESTPGWSQAALDYLHNYALTHEVFPAWFVTAAAGLTRSVPVKSGKAWGSIFVKAKKLGWIERAGFRPDPNRHMNPAPVWRSLIYLEAA